MLGFGTRQIGRATENWDVDCRITDFWPGSIPWTDLDTDEYIFPHRGPVVSNGVAEPALVSHCEGALCAAVYNAWSKAPDDAARRQIRDRLTVVALHDALDLGRKVCGDWYANKRQFSPDLVFRKQTRRQSPDLVAIEALDTLVSVVAAGKALGSDPLSLVRVAFHAAINPVVLCEDAFAISEMLSVSAWLGLVYRGRRVVMPGFVASYWSMILGGAQTWPKSDHAPDGFLIEHAASIFSFDRFVAEVEHVGKNGPTLIQRPRDRLRLVQ